MDRYYITFQFNDKLLQNKNDSNLTVCKLIKYITLQM